MDYREPLQVAAGDTIQWKRSLPEYSASDGWVLHYALRGPAIIDITGTADGSDHLISVPSSIDPAWTAGEYTVQGYVTNASGERHTVYSGRMTVTPNLAAIDSGTYDGRTHAQKVISAIEAVIEGKASKDQMDMQIDGLRITRIPFETLLQIRTRYRLELAAEIRKENRRQGRGSRRIIKFRL